MKPSMFSPGLSDPPAPSYPGTKPIMIRSFHEWEAKSFCDKEFIEDNIAGLAPSDYYTSSPYTQYSNYPSTVSYSNYGAPSPGGLLSK